MLDKIGIRHHSDKSSLIHGYLDIYEYFLEDFRKNEVQILEFGVGGGASLRTWLDFFPLAKIIGADPNAACRAFSGPRAIIETGAYDDPAFLSDLAERYDPSVVIDDGSHFWDHQILCLKHLFPVVRPGGFYIIEDLQTSFGKANFTTYARGATRSAFDYLHGLVSGLTAGPKLAAETADSFEAYFRSTAEFVLFRKGLIIIRKNSEKFSKQGETKLRLVPMVAAVPETKVFDHPRRYQRIPPRIIGAADRIAAPAMAEAAKGEVEAPASRVARIEDAMILGDGVVVTSTGSIVEESLINQRGATRFAGLYRVSAGARLAVHEIYPDPRRLSSGRDYVLLKQRWDGNFGHWLVESLPRLALAREITDTTKCLYILREPNEPAMRQVCLDSLAWFGVRPEQVLFVDNRALQVPSLIYPAPLTRQPWVKAPYAIRVLEEIAYIVTAEMPVNHETSERIYVSRNRTGRRRLLNEDQLIPLVESHGFRVVYPEHMPVTDQMMLFHDARLVIGNLGAALTNLVFSRPGVRLLALSTEFMIDDFFWDIICNKQGTYWSLHGKAANPALGMQSDFNIDCAAFSELLKEFVGPG
ncbi:glycosyltransferase 61 family protein [Falsiroseomonas sp. E2-1-a4]|uniref:glycosyltransferase 61 family protein n=1 Tax=Falsiroseomonas sp. E2-1-a4 TaxID=3239299 RepID=UPI003F419F01